ncbi:hypothetical protein [Azospirillum sp. B4]|uniref:hypothetical protein n=1 Tax=Azospirillum sp. B4 TaxID=95605 RepID=UPI0005C9B650|nr:hypothetical protein [Azospirillum sp. B4]
MKKRVAAVIMMAGLGFTGLARAECTLGTPPTIPDGSKAAETEMQATSAAVKKFMAETQDYMSCVEFEGKSGNGNWQKKYNDAVDQMQKLASEFNKQLKAFKAK